MRAALSERAALCEPATLCERTALCDHGPVHGPEIDAARPFGPLTLTERAALRLERLALRAGPFEACGLLLGRTPDHAEVAVRCRNRAPDPRRSFEIDPGHWVRWELLAARSGRAVVGVWHSHPEGPAWPSGADGAGAPPGMWSLVVTPPAAATRVALCAYRNGRSVPRSVTIQAGTPIETERDRAPRPSPLHP